MGDTLCTQCQTVISSPQQQTLIRYHEGPRSLFQSSLTCQMCALIWDTISIDCPVLKLPYAGVPSTNVSRETFFVSKIFVGDPRTFFLRLMWAFGEHGECEYAEFSVSVVDGR
jgi:hypothetical protein